MPDDLEDDTQPEPEDITDEQDFYLCAEPDTICAIKVGDEMVDLYVNSKGGVLHLPMPVAVAICFALFKVLYVQAPDETY